MSKASAMLHRVLAAARGLAGRLGGGVAPGRFGGILAGRFCDRLVKTIRARGRGRSIGIWAEQTLPERRIRWHQARLREAAGKLESRFSIATSTLETLSGKSSLLLESSRNLLKCALGQNGVASIFKSALAVTEEPLKFSEKCIETTNMLERNLAGIAERIGRLQRFRSTLDDSIAPLRILQTMFRIESASSSSEVQTLFLSLSAEIEDLLVRMSTLIASEFEAIADTGATVGDVRKQLAAIRERQVNTLNIREDIARSLQRLESQLEANRERDVRLVGVTEALSDRLGGIVSAIQYQDILNQRLEHVTQGLGAIAGQSAALKENSDIEALTFLRDAARVESAQLEDAEKVLEGAVETLRKSLQGLGDEMGDLGAECTVLNGIEAPSAASDGMVQILLDIIRENVELIESTTVENSGICKALEPIAGLLGNLTGSILELAARIRLIALNAQIQAAQAGDGTGLEVLSSRTRLIAEEMGSIVAAIAEDLAALKDGLQGALAGIEETNEESRQLRQFLGTNAKAQELRLHEFRDQLLAEFRCVEELVSYTQSESRSLAVSLDMRSSVLDVVTCTRDELQSFSERLSLRLGRVPANSRVEREQGSLYTAAAERFVHERALGLDASGSAAIASAEAPPAVEGSVELF